MANIKVKNLKSIQTAIRKEIIKASRDKQLRFGIGVVTVAEMRKINFGAASPVTIEFRKYFEKYNATHKTYNRNKLNTTFTGELLDDLKKNVKVKTTGGSIEYVVEHTNKKHKPYKRSKTAKKKQLRIPYKFISIQLRKRLGYDYFDLPSESLTKISKFFRKKIEKVILRNTKFK